MAHKDDKSLPPALERDSVDDEELQQMMREAFQGDRGAAPVDVLSGVQRRLRDRSQGKFYGDAWSTARNPPFATYFITSLMMLAVVVLIYAILTPIAGEPVELETAPAPVQLMPRSLPDK